MEIDGRRAPAPKAAGLQRRSSLLSPGADAYFSSEGQSVSSSALSVSPVDSAMQKWTAQNEAPDSSRHPLQLLPENLITRRQSKTGLRELKIVAQTPAIRGIAHRIWLFSTTMKKAARAAATSCGF